MVPGVGSTGSGGAVWRRFIGGLVLACSVASPLLFAGAARAADLPPPVYKPAPPPPPPPPPVAWSPFYVGAALNWVHHTGYVPNTPHSAQAYTFGGKVFGGYRITPGNRIAPGIQLELAYHYLGEVAFNEGSPILSHERSQAVAGSVMFFAPNLSPWIGAPVPIHVFVRVGAAYKDIHHSAFYGTFNEGILSAVLGVGWEYRILPRLFVRVEYEYLSTAIGGPLQSVPGLEGDYHVTIGGTRRAINVMHTPLALTVGVNL
jgi:OmpA-like transmembrane domain